MTQPEGEVQINQINQANMEEGEVQVNQANMSQPEGRQPVRANENEGPTFSIRYKSFLVYALLLTLPAVILYICTIESYPLFIGFAVVIGLIYNVLLHLLLRKDDVGGGPGCPFTTAIVYYILVVCWIDARTSQLGLEHRWQDIQTGPLSQLVTSWNPDKLHLLTDGPARVRADVYELSRDKDHVYRAYPLYLDSTRSNCNMSFFLISESDRTIGQPPPLTVFYVNFKRSNKVMYQQAIEKFTQTFHCSSEVPNTIRYASNDPGQALDAYDQIENNLKIAWIVFYAFSLVVAFVNPSDFKYSFFRNAR